MAAQTPNRARAAINLAHLAHNFREIRRIVAGDVAIWPAVKADAYGHGAARIVSKLTEAGAGGFCVAAPEEAAAIREAAGSRPVLVLGAPFVEDIPGILETGAECVVCNPRFARSLSEAAVKASRLVRAHLKVDTGMGRVGVRPEAAPALARDLSHLPMIELAGLMTHFPSADEQDLSFTEQEIEVFLRVRKAVEQSCGRRVSCHAANSAGTIRLSASHLDAVRPGIAMYGCLPVADPSVPVQLRPVMTLCARICHLKNVPPGDSVSYGRTWTAARPSRIATVCIGYGDGLPRMLSNRGSALVKGRLAPIAGRVCMDYTMLDVTDIPEVGVGDEAVFWGEQAGEEFRAEEVAAMIGTIPYELLVQVTSRVPRDYHE